MLAHEQSQKDLRQLQNGSAPFSHVNGSAPSSHINVKGLISCIFEHVFVYQALSGPQSFIRISDHKNW